MKNRRNRKDQPSTNPSPMQYAESMTDFKAEKTDPQGSYTGQPENVNEKPVQDADDL